VLLEQPERLVQIVQFPAPQALKETLAPQALLERRVLKEKPVLTVSTALMEIQDPQVPKATRVQLVPKAFLLTLLEALMTLMIYLSLIII
jgi:hypothetical protein